MRTLPVDQRMRIRILRIGGVALGALMVMAHPAIGGQAHEMIELTGIAMVLACIAGRMWSILYIGSRKNRDLVTSGPYSMTRNPLYVFSTVGAAGIGLMLGSFVAAFVLGLAAWLVMAVTAAREAEHLRTLFGARYDDYARRTPMFWPNPMLYREPEEGVFSPAILRRTFLDGLVFLLAFPLIEIVEHFQDAGYLPALYTLY